MDGLIPFFLQDTPGRTVMILAAVIACGISLGSVRVLGIELGIAGVLFVGLLFGHLGWGVDAHTLEFLREFGLMLFVYTIGLQVGPAFLSGFKKDGLRLNLMALAVVLMGGAITVVIALWGGIDFREAVGIFSGATTNTPSLGAAQQAIRDLYGAGSDWVQAPGLSYAVCYSYGVIGIILTMLLLKAVFRIRTSDEARAYAQAHDSSAGGVSVMDLRVDNPNLNGVRVSQVPATDDVVISRVYRRGQLAVVTPDTCLETGDLIRAVGRPSNLEALRLIVGSQARIPDNGAESGVVVGRVIVTRRRLANQSIGSLEAHRHGVTVTRLVRSGMEMTATADLEIQLSDTLVVVGDSDAIARFAKTVGNSVRELTHPHLVPVFLGIALGILLGSIPIHLPFVPAPVKLGLAGGPLVVAIALGRIGRVGPLVWYMPPSANFLLREIGIALFLACVGLKSGGRLVDSLVSGQGMHWFVGGLFVTTVPILVVGLWARLRYRMNFLSLCGLMAGSMTDPPALAYANQMASSNAQIVSYAAVYPLVMVMRIFTAQIIVILFATLR